VTPIIWNDRALHRQAQRWSAVSAVFEPTID
jgi:hypothetical protein